MDINTQDATSSCISAGITRIGMGINARANSELTLRNVSIIDIVREHLNVRCSTSHANVTVFDFIKNHLNARCSIICTLAEVIKYLDVTPAEVQWITDDVGVFFDVESNVEWIIVY